MLSLRTCPTVVAFYLLHDEKKGYMFACDKSNFNNTVWTIIKELGLDMTSWLSWSGLTDHPFSLVEKKKSCITNHVISFIAGSRTAYSSEFRPEAVRVANYSGFVEWGGFYRSARVQSSYSSILANKEFEMWISRITCYYIYIYIYIYIYLWGRSSLRGNVESFELKLEHHSSNSVIPIVCSNGQLFPL